MKKIRVYRSGIHLGEERLVLGNQSAGMINFSGCHLACQFCYTPETSVHKIGVDLTGHDLLELMEDLIRRGARNLNLISPTHYWPLIKRPLAEVREKFGKGVPIVLKTSGYESKNLAEEFCQVADVLVPDFKVYGEREAVSVNLPGDYGQVARRAVETMISELSSEYTTDGKLSRGILIRHLLMPGFFEDSLAVVQTLGEAGFRGHLNLMTYFWDSRLKSLCNANPNEVSILAMNAQFKGMSVLINGKPVENKDQGDRSYAHL